MSDVVLSRSSSRFSGRRIGRARGVLVALGVFVVLLIVNNVISPQPMTYFEVSFMSSGGTTLALAAVGQTIAVLSGGFDLSAGAVISLVNVVLSTSMHDSPSSMVMWSLAGIGIGALCGAFNGLFIAFFRLQPIVVTLSTMFIVQGVTLLIMERPGGMIPSGLSAALVGDAIPGVLPMPLVILAAVVLLWLWLKNTPFGRAIYAVGSDVESARAQGVRVSLVRFLVYVIAGGCYGGAGVFISAQQGGGDPLVGNPLLLQIFAAVVVGGTLLGGGRGGPVGSIIGAYVLMIVVNILLVLNVSAYYETIVEGCILILAVLAGSFGRQSVLVRQTRGALARLRAWRAGTLPRQGDRSSARLSFALATPARQKPAVVPPPFLARHAEVIGYALPAYIGFVIVVFVTEAILGHALLSWPYYNTLLVLSVFMLILALGQGTVILTGGLDLSLPWTIALCGIVFAGTVRGVDASMLYALPLALAIGLAVGLLNGLGIVVLGLSPIVMTLAMNGILQGVALVYSQGTPDGFSSPALRWFMTDKSGWITPVVPFVLLFVLLGTVLLTRTPFGRRVYGIGNGQRVAALSGISVGPTLVLVYMLSGLCAALVGCLLTGFSGQANLGMGDEYLLPSIAVVVVGGTLITGGRGHYLAMTGGVLLFTALQTLLAGTTLPFATRAIVFGVVVLGAVITLRERQS
jgi:ribose transport system permease protein